MSTEARTDLRTDGAQIITPKPLGLGANKRVFMIYLYFLFVYRCVWVSFGIALI